MKQCERQRRAAAKEKKVAYEKEQRRLSRVPIAKPIPLTEFHKTAIGLAKWTSHKYANRWRKALKERKLANADN